MGEASLGEPPVLLKTLQLNKIYGEGEQAVRALHDVELELRGGHIYALLGPNGAGKTTFLRICATLIRPTSGDVWVGPHHTVREAEAVRARPRTALRFS